MNKEQLDKIYSLKEQIDRLPNGYISTKNIKGNVYYYHQWTENGIKQSKYLTNDELKHLLPLIEKRQSLEEELKLLKKGYDVSKLILCTLMHLDEKVIDLYIDSETGFIKKTSKQYNLSHLPVGAISDGAFSENKLSEWWNDRSIPLSRSGIREALEKLELNNPQLLLLKCQGLSLSDQYWIKLKDSNIEWRDINFFDHDFADDVGEILFGSNKKQNDLDLSSPDNTSVGNLKKKWKISNGQRVLIKGGSNPFRQEPFNEVVASKVAKALDIPVVEYSLFFDNDYPYSKCLDFVGREEDLVSAYQIGRIIKKSNNDNNYTHLIKCANYLGIKDIIDYINKMIVFDFIIANEDRHFNNIAFVRNALTLEYVGPSPIFDSGSSFGYNKIANEIDAFENIESKPFKSTPLEQLSLVTSYDWLTTEKLDNAKKEIEESFRSYKSVYLPEDRINEIISSAHQRIEFIKEKIK